MLLFALIAVVYVPAFQAITLDEFKARPIPAFAEKLEGQDLVDYVNNVQTFFKFVTRYDCRVHQGIHSALEIPPSEDILKASLSTLDEVHKKAMIMDQRFIEVHNTAIRTKEPDTNNITIPENFDARVRWPYCTSIKTIRDQSACGSCWAVSAASAMSDRLCIQSEGKIQLIVSDTDILSCCQHCGNGCSGGWKDDAWSYAVSNGYCTGGAYGKKGVCKPYPFHPCGYHKGQPYYGKCPNRGFTEPLCQKVCQPGYLKAYDSDKIYAESVYKIIKDAKATQKEIMMNGPVLASFLVYEDFLNYKSGVYVHTAGKRRGGHAVKIIGWGVEGDIPYWLVSNSWSMDWGENGLFRIARGKDECGVEAAIVAGTMKV